MLRRALYPNLDADEELGARGPYQPKRAIVEKVHAHRGLENWTRQDHVLEFEHPALFDASRFDVVLCWCPTVRALATLKRAGWPVPGTPGQDILRRVNDRRFLLERASADLERTWVAPGDDLAWLDSGRRFRLKRPFGFAGRGQRTVGPAPSAHDRRWIQDSLVGGFVRERECDVVEEWSLHGVVDEQGVLLGEPCRQAVDRFGSAFAFERRPGACRFETELVSAARDVASELLANGYFGPFGIDAFSYLDQGKERFNALSDLNARFTLCWSLGMGERREEALRRLEAG